MQQMQIVCINDCRTNIGLSNAGLTVKVMVTFSGLIGTKLPFTERLLITIFTMPQVGDLPSLCIAKSLSRATAQVVNDNEIACKLL